ncbi:AmiS/UreI family transporter [Kineococcus sp. SYSU DK001]|uniref:AmiS/UreI family transporter n=1 Tax=Kineococcus sp. SYSU DK001 TaxID=3383122 RepID=UPI003D7D59A5
MGSVGLLYVGAVLLVNGLSLLGLVGARDAVPINLFVGGLQVLTPTYLVFTAGGDPDAVLSAAGLYLFGFTYLYVALGTLLKLDGTGLGWFSAFVAACALVYSGLNFTRFDDPAFGVIWLMWAFLWFLFFLLLARGRTALARWTGAVAAVQGITTGAVPAFMLLTGTWAEHTTTAAVVLAVVAVVAFAGTYPLTRRPVPPTAPGGPSPGDPPGSTHPPVPPKERRHA